MSLSIIIAAYIFYIGCAIGSFLNVLIDRLPQEKSIGGRSHCDHCKKKLALYDLIPLFSFIFLKGHCRYCHKKFSSEYFLMELFTGLVFVSVFFLGYGNGMVQESSLSLYIFIKILELVFASACIVIFFSDVKFQIIPDSMQVALLASGIVLHLTLWGISQTVFVSMVTGALITLPLLLIHIITKGKGMGFGDVKLAVVIGLFTGLKLGISVLYIAFITGAIVGIFSLIVKKAGMKSKIAFGPFLLVGLFLTLLFQNQINTIINIYFGGLGGL